MFQGRATVLEDAEAERADPSLREAQMQMGDKYAGGHGESGRTDYTARTGRGRHWRWVRFTPDRAMTWDNVKLRRG